jgi:hypothetical protein
MKLSKIVIAAFTAVSLFSISFAQPAATASAPAKKTATALKSTSGTVASIDAIGNTIVIKKAKTSDTLKVDSETAITIAGKKATLADLKSGTNVSVSYKIAEGSKVAVSIKEKVKTAPAPAPSAAPATK